MVASLPSSFGEEPTYWRHGFGEDPAYYRLELGRDWLLVDGAWTPWNRYKHGPSWWRLTGEWNVDQISFEDLPPGTPR